MRRVITLVLMLSGAFAFALGLDLLRRQGSQPELLIGLAAGCAAFLTGMLLELRRSVPQADKPARTPVAAPLGTATLAFSGQAAPRIVSRDGDLDVIADGDGTVRFTLKQAAGATRLVCRSDGAAWFNTLRQDPQLAAIKLIGPVPPVVRLELWDQAELRKAAPDA